MVIRHPSRILLTVVLLQGDRADHSFELISTLYSGDTDIIPFYYPFIPALHRGARLRCGRTLVESDDVAEFRMHVLLFN